MGRYLNPGGKRWRQHTTETPFVDKTEMIAQLNMVVCTEMRYVCVTRPQGFGKTWGADMVCAYYDRGTDARPAFQGLKIGSGAPRRGVRGELTWDTYLGAFDVIRITMGELLSRGGSIDDALSLLEREVSRELRRAYPDVDYFDEDDFVDFMESVYDETGVRFVAIIDDWDAPFWERTDDIWGQRRYVDFLGAWLKDQPCVALAYMTGILPPKKYGTHSGPNMFCEYTMLAPAQLAPYTGFTEEEVIELCRRYRFDFASIKEWYDGYEVRYVGWLEDRDNESGAEAGEEDEEIRYSLYSPLSVTEALRNRNVGNYWNESETFIALADQINRDFGGLKEKVALLMGGGRIPVNTRTYQNDLTSFGSADDVLTMLVHLGYLGFDERTAEVFVPNREVLCEFGNATGTLEWAAAFRELEESKELLRATWELDAERVGELLESAHDRVDNRSYNSESALRFAVLDAYYAARLYYTVIPELDSGKGYADIAFLPSPSHPEVPALVVELKWNRDVRTAIDQIRDRDYPQRLAHYEGHMMLVGINYDRDVRAGAEGYKRHSCVIERA